jgi:hypothetical protein
MTTDLLEGCTSAKAGLSAVFSRAGLRRLCQGESLGSPTNEAFRGNVEFAVKAADHFQG